jgi:hypothetical protein
MQRSGRGLRLDLPDRMWLSSGHVFCRILETPWFAFGNPELWLGILLVAPNEFDLGSVAVMDDPGAILISCSVSPVESLPEEPNEFETSASFVVEAVPEGLPPSKP